MAYFKSIWLKDDWLFSLHLFCHSNLDEVIIKAVLSSAINIIGWMYCSKCELVAFCMNVLLN